MASNGITQPTEVQQMSIPGLLKGGDAIVQAKTGTGKTLAFLLPIFEKLNLNAVGAPQALIIAPTRELALQIATEANKLAAAYEGVRILAAYGGQDVERQLRKLEGGCHLVVGTPGRLLDHMGRGTLDLTKIRTLVLDEADQMLHMGFLPDVEKMINATSPARQTMLFSATIPDGIRRLSAQYMRTPKDIRVGPAESVPLKLIRQLVVECTPRGKLSALREYLEQEKPYLAVIFCRTKKRAAELNQQLKELGYSSDELHGDLSQNKREQVMRAFREAKLQLLVATDVAARGIDVEGITHVFNYDIPQDAEYYIHRIGRTGRAGETGKAITFVTPHDRDELQAIEQGTSQKLERQIARTSIESDDSGELLSNVEAKAGRRATHKSRDQDRKKDGKRGDARRGAYREESSGGRSGGRGKPSSTSERDRFASRGGTGKRGERKESTPSVRTTARPEAKEASARSERPERSYGRKDQARSGSGAASRPTRRTDDAPSFRRDASKGRTISSGDSERTREYGGAGSNSNAGGRRSEGTGSARGERTYGGKNNSSSGGRNNRPSSGKPSSGGRPSSSGRPSDNARRGGKR